jgi:hypothetical protein
MASLAPLSSMKKRSDRFVCKLKDYDAKSIKVIGSDGGLGLQDRKENSVHPWDCVVSVDLLPSCHRGLVLTIAPNGPARVGELDRESPDGRSLGINKGGSLFLSFCSCSFLCSMRKLKIGILAAPITTSIFLNCYIVVYTFYKLLPLHCDHRPVKIVAPVRAMLCNLVRLQRWRNFRCPTCLTQIPQ